VGGEGDLLVVVMGAALVTMADSAKAYLRKRNAASHEEAHQEVALAAN